MVAIKRPVYNADQSGYTRKEIEEMLVIAAWRNGNEYGRWDVLVAMINTRCELRLVWHDPLCEMDEGDVTP